jgi:hypothetical protein
MCRIDAPFGDHPLDEKKDPAERFLQALDEFEVVGNFRTLLIKHFSENWIDVFYGASNFEEALKCAKDQNSDPEKCIAVLLYKDINIQFRLMPFRNGFPNRDSLLFDFLNDVANTYFPGSPFGFHKAGMEKLLEDYSLFVYWLYGEEYFFKQDFFDDKLLNSLNGRERTSILWDCFYLMVPQIKGLRYNSNESILLKELTSIASSSFISGPLTKGSSEILRGLEFIKTWIKFDSQAGRLSYRWTEFLYDFNKSPWLNIETLLRSDTSACEETSKLLNKWLGGTEREFKRILYVNADLSHASDIEIEQWASGLDGYFRSYINSIYSDYDFNQLTNDDLKVRLSNILNELCSQLTSTQINTWIKYSVKEDVQSLLNSNDKFPRLPNSAEIWGRKEYFGIWKKLFLESFNKLDTESQLRILSASMPFVRGQSENFYQEFSSWWKELFSNLIEQDNFPKKLTPSWTMAAMDRLDREFLFPYVDKSIGILRGELSKTGATEEEINIYHQQLERLLTTLDSSSPVKAQRHRLLLMRSSTVPFSDKTISKMGGLFDRESFSKWYDSLKHLGDTQLAYQINGNKAVTVENHLQVKNDFYVAFSHELAEFCLNRLRLRKGEKAKDEKYDSSQVVEQSSVWRQGYLKALIELGFDLNGKVHKTVNFIKKSDPDEHVRAIASECYKEVRRNAKKNPSIQDIKRGIVAAEWWLLISQRRELGLKIIPEEARKTRRNLMRNP